MSHEVSFPGVRLHVPVRLQPPVRSPKNPSRHEVVMGWCYESRKPAPGPREPPAMLSLQHLPPPCQPGLSPWGPAASGSDAGGCLPSSQAQRAQEAEYGPVSPEPPALAACGVRKGTAEAQR